MVREEGLGHGFVILGGAGRRTRSWERHRDDSAQGEGDTVVLGLPGSPESDKNKRNDVILCSVEGLAKHNYKKDLC